jgi:hypothetical protein
MKKIARSLCPRRELILNYFRREAHFPLSELPEPESTHDFFGRMQKIALTRFRESGHIDRGLHRGSDLLGSYSTRGNGGATNFTSYQIAL